MTWKGRYLKHLFKSAENHDKEAINDFLEAVNCDYVDKVSLIQYSVVGWLFMDEFKQFENIYKEIEMQTKT